MDIIGFLKADHARLREEIERIGAHLSDPDAIDHVSVFSVHFDLHEKVSRQMILSKMHQIELGPRQRGLFEKYERSGEDFRPLLNDLKEYAGSAHPLSVRLAFANFRAYMQSRFDYEEGILFPEVAKAVGAKVREKLGEAAARQYARFAHPLEALGTRP